MLNIEFLSRPPYSCVNIPENLVPVRGDASAEDLIDIAEQYKQSPQSTEVLEVSLKNLAGDTPDQEAFSAKWSMINDN